MQTIEVSAAEFRVWITVNAAESGGFEIDRFCTKLF